MPKPGRPASRWGLPAIGLAAVACVGCCALPLLVAAAALLILGVVLGRHVESGAAHPVVAATGESQESHHDESTERTHAEPGVPANGGGEAAERLTGISVESPVIVALGSIAS